MICPACPDERLAITDRHGIEVDYCPARRGIWLDRGELDKLLDRAEAGDSNASTTAASAHSRSSSTTTGTTTSATRTDTTSAAGPAVAAAGCCPTSRTSADANPHTRKVLPMNSALLVELQRQSAYPSVTVLLNTSPGSVLATAERARAGQLLDTAAERLRGDVDDGVAADIMDQLHRLLDEQAGLAAGDALALCVSPAFAAAVKLGRTVTERVVIDDTFATRDLVADLNRTAEYRLLTISERTVRSFVGDRRHLLEERDEHWPLRRLEEHSATGWANAIADALHRLQQQHPLPTVVAGVDRSVRRHTAALAPFHTIGFVPGNHDRTSWAELHNATWPVVTDWLRSDAADALERLDAARSSRRYAGGVHEIWPLANDARVDTLVVEDGHALPARITDDGQLEPTDEVTAPDVVDDIVDETIEAVLRHGGRVVVTEPGQLAAHHHIAAVLRY